MPHLVQSCPYALGLVVLLAPAPVHRPITVYLGTEITETDSKLTISVVFASSPASEAGLLATDEILTFDRVPVRTVADLSYFLKKKKAGDSISVVVRREGKEHPLRVKLGERRRFGYLGTILGDLQISEISAGSPASKAGLQVEDLIVSIDGTKLETMLELVEALKARKPGQMIEILVRRGDKDVKVQVELGDRPGY